MNGINRTYQPQQPNTYAANNIVKNFHRLVSQLTKNTADTKQLNSVNSTLLLNELIAIKEAFIQVADDGNDEAFETLYSFIKYSAQLVSQTGINISEFIEGHRDLYFYFRQEHLSTSPTATFLRAKLYGDGVLFEKDENRMIELLKQSIALSYTRSEYLAYRTSFVAHNAADDLVTVYENRKNQQVDHEKAYACQMEAEYWRLVKNNINFTA